MPRKLLDVSALSEFGWTRSIGLADGLKRLKSTYEWFLENGKRFVESRYPLFRD